MIKKITDAQHQLTTFKCTGETTVGDIVETARSLFADSPTLNVLWDFTQTRISGTSPKFARESIQYAKEVEHLRIGGKTAVVVSTDIDYGLGRMFQTLSKIKGVKYETQVFRSLDEAKNWLLPNSEP